MATSEIGNNLSKWGIPALGIAGTILSFLQWPHNPNYGMKICLFVFLFLAVQFESQSPRAQSVHGAKALRLSRVAFGLYLAGYLIYSDQWLNSEIILSMVMILSCTASLVLMLWAYTLHLQSERNAPNTAA